ncbi:MAG: hypothetical protein WCW77_02120 [Patescibacteria group bacterium]|jgi:hypothetical protein
MEKPVSSKAIISPKNESKLGIYIKYSGWFNLALIVLILAGGAYFILKPRFEKARADADTAPVYEEYASFQRELDKLNKRKDLFKDISPEDMDKVARLIPDEENLEKLFPLLEALVERSGMILVSLKTEAVEEKVYKTRAEVQQEEEAPQVIQEEEKSESLPPEIKVVKISLEAGGADYSNTKGLLRAFENNLKLMDVKKVNFSEGKSCRLEIETYYLKKPAASQM